MLIIDLLKTYLVCNIFEIVPYILISSYSNEVIIGEINFYFEVWN